MGRFASQKRPFTGTAYTDGLHCFLCSLHGCVISPPTGVGFPPLLFFQTVTIFVSSRNPSHTSPRQNAAVVPMAMD